MKFEEFRKIYSGLEKKYSLPLFDEMNLAFDIGKIKRDSGNLLRDIRRAMNDKIAYYLRLIEIIINPSQAPPTFLMLLKEVNKEDKIVLNVVFTAFIELEIDSYKLNITSTDVQEAQSISKIYKIWHENMANLTSVLNILDRNWRQTVNAPKQKRDYFN